ncbi:MAG TPA: hypothetical protein VFB32_06930 [Rudaea sp.]|nr:hypothetical protein [Rudaea sp.]
MPVLRFRLTGSRNSADAVLAEINGIDGLERVEEVDDEMGDLRDDSTSLELPDDLGADVFRIEVEAPHAATLARVHDTIEIAARDSEAAVEFVERF